MKNIPFLPEVKQHIVKYKESAWSVTAVIPNHLLGLNEIKSSVPLWQEDATGVWWVQDPTAFYCFALSAAALHLFTLLKQWIFDFLSNKTGKSLLRASSTLQKPIYTKTQKAKGYFTQFPHESLTLGGWNLDQLFGTRALSTSKWSRETHQSS